jgi:ATP-dependent DNA helicase RecG
METEKREYKKTIAELKHGIISIVAILNKHQEGELIFGLDNLGKEYKQDINEKTLRDISQVIANSIEPKIYPEINKEGNIVKIKFSGKEIPYFAYGRAYIRTADEDKQMSAKELENFILRKEQIKWDSKISREGLENIKEDLLKNYILKSNQANRINFKFSTKQKVLKKLDLIKEEKLTNAGKVLFSDSQPVEAQAAIFAGTDKTTFLDIKQFKGNIFELLDFSERYLQEHINWKADLSGSKRIEIPEVPVRAIKEALVNSFCHRDFQAPESNKVAIFKDRISIWNPGDFPEGYSPEDFITQETPSVLRNPLIANILYLSQDIEKWGSGLKRIYQECKEADVKVEFRKEKYGFSVIFYRSTPQATPQATPQEELTILENKILEEIRANKEVSRSSLSKKLGIGEDTIKEYLKKLKTKGILKRIGKTSAGHWEIL